MVQFTRFFCRNALQFDNEQIEFIPAKYENINAFLFAPVQAGLWKQHELWDGTYNLDDLLDIHEMMNVAHENERRARLEAERREGF